MSSRNISCQWNSVPESTSAPCNRYKHASCAYGGNVYLFGGRAEGTLRDFWKYDVACNNWIKLDCSDKNVPDDLEDHTMVAHQGVLYIFGGLGVYSTSKTPLWLFDTVKKQWLQSGKESSHMPASRKGHSAVVLRSSMYIYGGYIGMRECFSEFWKFDLENREWSQLNDGKDGPGPRYCHSAMAHQDSMYIYGGRQRLNEKSDLWKWNFSNQTWSRIIFWNGPSKLIGHSAVVYKDNMLLFGGGETLLTPNNDIWRLSLTTKAWEKLSSKPGSNAPCRIHHCSVGLGYSFQSSMPVVIGAKETSTYSPEDIELQPLRNKEKIEAMPDQMLILGGFPIKEQATISVWKLTLIDN